MEQNMCFFTKAFEAEEKLSLQDSEQTWKLRYEQQQQEFAKAAQEWRSREQLLLKLLKERETPRVSVDIEERFNISSLEPRITHLNHQVTQIELGTAANCLTGDNHYYSVVTITVEKCTPLEEAETAQETVGLLEIEEPSTQVEDEIPEKNPDDYTRSTASVEASKPHKNVLQEMENTEDKSTLEEPEVSPIVVIEARRLDEKQVRKKVVPLLLYPKKKKRKRRRNRNKNESMEVEDSPQALQDVTPETSIEISADDSTSFAPLVDEDAGQHSEEVKVLEETDMGDISTPEITQATCVVAVSQPDVIQPEDARILLCETEPANCEDQKIPAIEENEVQDTWETLLDVVVKEDEVPEDWFTCSQYIKEEPEEKTTLSEPEATPIKVAQVLQCEEVEIQASATPAPATSTTRKKKKKNKNKKIDGMHFTYNDPSDEFDQFCDYEEACLQGRKARTKVKNVVAVSSKPTNKNLKYSEDYEDYSDRF